MNRAGDARLETKRALWHRAAVVVTDSGLLVAWTVTDHVNNKLLHKSESVSKHDVVSLTWFID